ncbi:MAG: hypothetical protein K2H76_07200 [Muribaculaceae bacterium]|nr:hypothetical protein [Muribaculaceae bacterium]
MKDLNIDARDRKLYPNQNEEFNSLNSLSAELGEIDEDLKDIAADLPDGHDYRSDLLSKSITLRLDRVMTQDEILSFIDSRITALFEAPSNWTMEAFKVNAARFIEDWAHRHEALFKEKCSKTYAQRDAIMVNVVITKEEREMLQKIVKIGFDPAIIEKAPEYAKKVQILEEENENLRKELEKYKRLPIAGPSDGSDGLPIEQQRAYLEEAKGLILESLEEEGFDTTCHIWDKWTHISGVRKRDTGAEYPIVFRSNRSHRQTVITPTDWDMLMKENAMFGIVTEAGVVRTYNLRDLLKQAQYMNIRFDVANFDIPERLDQLSGVMRHFKGIQFDFGQYIQPSQTTWMNFLVPELNTGEKAISGNLDAF